MEKGVQLLLPDSPAVDALKILMDTGVELLACKTCTDNYGITDKIAAGRISNMAEIVSVMHDADKLISL